MKTTIIECDNCKRDMSTGKSHPEYMLVLTAQRVPDNGTIPLDLNAIKPIEEDHHFCDVNCLGSWASKRKVYAA